MPVQIRQLITHLNFKAAHSGTGTKSNRDDGMEEVIWLASE